MSSIVCLCATFLAVTAIPSQSNSSLPVVDLGYVLQRATTFNQTSGIYAFSNIRYAQPPTGELRFQAPRCPKTNRTIQTGEDDRICYQAFPTWFISLDGATPQLLNETVNSTYVDESEHPTPLQVPPPATPPESEDCLFLDVQVPEKTFCDRHNGHGAAVIVWIHGGGFTVGSKFLSDPTYDPTGLLAQSVLQTGKEAVYVALNYRLGAFGWSGGPSLQSDGSVNAGLLDQRLALDWVQTNIKSFGGDPKRVTVVGESAGAWSIFGHLTSYGGENGPVPFQKSLTQSSIGSALTPSVSEQIFQSFLKTANVTSIQEARALSAEELQVANSIQISGSQWGSFTYALVIDGTYVPNQPIRLLLDGNFHKDVHVMQGHNTNEGLIFTPPYAQTTSGYDTFVTSYINSTDIAPLTQTLYPPIFDGTYGYTNNIGRAAATFADAEIICSSTALTRAVNNCTYNYIFAVPPSLHTDDLNYTFYTGKTAPQEDPYAQAAVDLQRWVGSFAIEGRPAAVGTEAFGEYGEEGMVQTVGLNGVGREVDPAVAARCDYWFEGKYK